MDSKKKYTEIREQFTNYLVEKKLRRTEERYAILDCIFQITEHFDMCMLHQRLEELGFHVSRATVYNTLDVLEDCGLIVRHQFMTQAVQYELRFLAETHAHLVCSRCGTIRELKEGELKDRIRALKMGRFSPEYHALYVYGVCGKCKKRNLRK